MQVRQTRTLFGNAQHRSHDFFVQDENPQIARFRDLVAVGLSNDGPLPAIPIGREFRLRCIGLHKGDSKARALVNGLQNTLAGILRQRSFELGHIVAHAGRNRIFREI